MLLLTQEHANLNFGYSVGHPIEALALEKQMDQMDDPIERRAYTSTFVLTNRCTAATVRCGSTCSTNEQIFLGRIDLKCLSSC